MPGRPNSGQKKVISERDRQHVRKHLSRKTHKGTGPPVVGGVRDLWFFFGNSASPCQHSPSLTLWFRSCMRWDSSMPLPSLLFRSWWWVTRERKIRCRVHSAAGILSIFVQVSIFLVYRSGKSENFYFILWIVAILKAWWSWQRSKLPEVRFARN